MDFYGIKVLKKIGMALRNLKLSEVIFYSYANPSHALLRCSKQAILPGPEIRHRPWKNQIKT